MALTHLTTTGTQDAALILSKIQTMKMLVVPFCYSFHVDTSTLECLLGSISSGQRPTYHLSTGHSETHCETGSQSARHAFETATCQDFVARLKGDGRTSAAILVRQSKSPEDREIGRRFKPLWEVLAPEQQEIFPNRDAKGNFVVPALDVRAQILSIYDRRNGFGKPVFKLASWMIISVVSEMW